MSEEAVVIGGGPVGLYAAHCLARRGVSVRVLEAGRAVQPGSYACGLQPSTLASFQRTGLLPALERVAHRIDQLTIRRDAGELARLDFARAASPSCWLTLQQAELEQLLSEALRARGVPVVLDAEVTRVSARDGFVRVSEAACHVAAPDAIRSGRSWDAKYVIGADGQCSVCRQALGIELVEQHAPKVFAVYDFQSDLGSWAHRACLASQQGLLSAFWPLGPQLGRWTFELRRGWDELPTLASLRALVAERAGWFAPLPEQLSWADVAEFRRSTARRFGNGRVWLAGDAAHSDSPIGFQSMNRGLGEVERLASGIGAELRAQRRHSARRERGQASSTTSWATRILPIMAIG